MKAFIPKGLAHRRLSINTIPAQISSTVELTSAPFFSITPRELFPGSLLNEHFSWVAVGEPWAGNQGFESLPTSAAENSLHIWPWVSCFILLLSLAPQRNRRQGCWGRGSAVGKGYWDLLCVPTCWVLCASSICHVAPQGPCPCLLVTRGICVREHGTHYTQGETEAQASA